MDVDKSANFALPVIAGVLVVVLSVLAYFFWSTPSADDVEEESTKEHANGDDDGDKKEAKAPKPKKTRTLPSKVERKDFTHEFLANSLKGHATAVTDFDIAPNGKFLVSCGTDRSVFVWNIKDPYNKNHKFSRANVEFDCAKLIKFSPDSKSFICSLENGNNIRVFKFNKKDDGTPVGIQPALEEDFNKTLDKDILNIGIDSVGNFVMTCDIATRFDILSLRGDLYHTQDTGTFTNSCAVVSPCGRFVAVSGFTSDAKIWSVDFSREKAFTGVKRAFNLKGHTAAILSLSFNSDSSRMISVSKDGTWKLWRTNVDLGPGADADELKSVKFDFDPSNQIKCCVSPDGLCVCLVINDVIYLYNTISGKLDTTIEQHFTSGLISQIRFSIDGLHLYVSGDRHIRVFRNVTGVRSTISDLTEKLVTCNKNIERRLQDQLTDAKAKLKSWGGE